MNRLKLAFMMLVAKDLFVSYTDCNGERKDYVTDVAFLKKVYVAVGNQLKKIKNKCE